MADIIVIEDDADFAKLLVESLDLAGHSTRHFLSVWEALEAFNETPAEVIIADLYYGGRIGSTGLDVIFKFRNAQRADDQAPKIIVMSGAFPDYGRENLLRMSKELGAFEAFEKPFHPNDLLMAIDAALSGQTNA